MSTYIVQNMRVIEPGPKTAERNPDRLFIVYGEFFNESGEELSFGSKEVTRTMASNPEFDLDFDKGLLTIPSGVRGRKKSVGLTPAQIKAHLDSVRKGAK